MKFVSVVSVFPNVPPAPGMPCQGEDSEFSSSKQNITLFIYNFHDSTIFNIIEITSQRVVQLIIKI